MRDLAASSSVLRADDLPEVRQVAARFGAQAHRTGSSWALSPCPACGATLRHRKSRDKRGAVGLTPNGRGWHCFQCEAQGGSLDWVAYAQKACAYRLLAPADKPDIWNWFREEFTSLDSLRAPTSYPIPPKKHTALPPSEQAVYPSASQLAILWDQCSPVSAHAGVAHWLRDARGLEPARLTGELARCVPQEALPNFARFGGKTWPQAGYHLLLPLFDAHGVMRSVLARRTGAGEGPKSVAPRGFGRRALVLANPSAQRALEAGARPPSAGTKLRWLISEGEMDFLTWASRDLPELAVLGIFSGSWQPALAARIPRGAEVIVRTHPDAQGDRYAAQIAESLEGRCRLLRPRSQGRP